MPTYDYVCDACNHEFELFQSMTDRVKRKCPKCGKPRLKRLIGTGAGVIFKGSGFHETDYRSESYKKAAEAEKKAAQGKTPKKDDKAAKSKAKSSDSSSSSQSSGGSQSKDTD
ncbi:MAG: zinc ribbon domain-containing protein [Planctomycetes bacterium]|nr:zinc ribbon domain-containing protein [Planctomycetota bacterium]